MPPFSEIDVGATATVTVGAALDGWSTVAVTVAVPPFSAIDVGATVNVTVGVSSSSVIVPVPVAASSVAFTGLLSVTTTVSCGSSVVSPVTDTVRVWLVAPAVKVSVPAGSAV